MNNVGRCLHSGFVVILAISCSAGRVLPREGLSGPSVPFASGGGVSRVLARTAPEYPPIAKANYLQGNVDLELRVNGKGTVASAHVVAGNAILAVAAL
jgi:hypothetical protein